MERYPTIPGFDISGPFNVDRRRATPRAAGASSSAGRQRRGGGSPAPGRSCAHLARQAFRRPVTEEDLKAPWPSMPGPRGRRFRRRHPERADGDPGPAPSSCIRTQAPPPGHASPAGTLTAQRPGAGLAAVVLPVERGTGPGAAGSAATAGQLHDPACWMRRCSRMLADPRSHSLVTNFAFQWLNVHGIDCIEPGPDALSGLHRGPARGLPRGDAAVPRTASCAPTAACWTC